MYLMSAAWGALALVLSALAGLYTWWAWRRRGARGLTRGVALVLLPIAMWLTGTLRLFAVTADWLAGWATGLVLSPTVIVGTVLALVSVALFSLSGRLGARAAAPGASGERAVTARRPAADPVAADDGLDDDIQALLRKRGIS